MTRMTQISGRVMVIDDGGVAALVACCLCSDPARVTPYAAPGPGPSAPSRLEAVKRRAELLGLGDPVLAPRAPREKPSDSPSPSGETDERALATDLLLQAGRESVRRGLRRLVWPVSCGADLEDMEREIERARLVERLVNLDAPLGDGSSALRLETPLIDLTDRQIAELATDLDAPLDVAWWCRKDGPAPCGRCGGCHRWEAALGQARAVVRPRGTTAGVPLS